MRLPETEAGFMRAVIELAQLEGWRTFHVHDSRHSPAGFPDVVLLRGTRLGFLELKTERGRVSPAQQEWIDALAAVQTVGASIVRPSDWPEIEASLRSRP